MAARAGRALFASLAVAGLASLFVGCGSSSTRGTAPTPPVLPSGKSSCGVGGDSAVLQLLRSRHITITVDGQTMDSRTVGFQVCAAAQRDLMAAQMAPQVRESLRESAQANCHVVPNTSGGPVSTSASPPLTVASSPPTSIYLAPQGPGTTAPSLPRTSTFDTPTTWVNPPPPAVTTASTAEIQSGIAQAVFDEVLYRDAVTQGKAVTIQEAQAAVEQGDSSGDPQAVQHLLTVSKMLNELIGSTKCQVAGIRVHNYLLAALRAHHVKVSGRTGWTASNYIGGIADTAAATAASPGTY
jgi:hypothetical protein